MTPRRIVGVEKNYDWGDEITIRHSMGLPSTRGTKVAEMWFGTHPMGPSVLGSALDEPVGSGQIHAIARALGEAELLSSVTGPMTMLVKLLACAQPLSLQTHPTKEQAREGFAREEAFGIPRDAPHRMYRDESDKPEMIVALSRFEALCGFAPVDDSVEFLKSMGWTAEANTLSSEGIDAYLRWSFDQADIPSMSHSPEWLRRIAHLYPTDPALRIAPLLNHVVLEPGQALSLPAGNLHAYLHGFGLEVMNSSDNVIRAGFTNKHLDVNELLRIVDTSTLENPVVEMSTDGTFPSPSTDFSVSTLNIDAHRDCQRIVHGMKSFPREQQNLARFPEFSLVPAGESGAGWFENLIVCTQH